MKAAIVPEAGRAPVYGHLKEPTPVSRESRIAVTADALSPVVKARASGTHYSSKPFRYPKSNGFGRAILMCPASCSRLARNAGDFGS